MILKRAMRPTEVRLSENPLLANGENPPVQILRVGKFSHPKYGEFEITKKVLSDMVSNFKANVRGIDIALDYFHKSDEDASGWLKTLVLTEGGTELWGLVDWTPKAKVMLDERSVRYFSPDFAFVWKDPETGKSFNNVLFGGGLTNRPFVKDMAAIVADEKGESTMTEVEKLTKLAEEQSAQIKTLMDESKAAKLKLAEVEKKMDEKDGDDKEGDDKEGEGDSDSVPSLKKKLAEMQKSHAKVAEAHGKLMAQHEALMAEHAKAEEAKKMAEKTSAFNVLLTEGKAVAAQKAAFMKDDMAAFIKLAQPVNLEGLGISDANGDEVTDEKIMKLAEERVTKSNGSLDLGQAISAVRRELMPQKTK